MGLWSYQEREHQIHLKQEITASTAEFIHLRSLSVLPWLAEASERRRLSNLCVLLDSRGRSQACPFRRAVVIICRAYFPVFLAIPRKGRNKVSSNCSEAVLSRVHLDLQSCVVRSWSFSDAIALQRYADNRNIWLNLRDAFPSPYTLEDSHAFLSRVTEERPETNFAIAISSEAIGSIGLRLGRDVHGKTAELGYWLGEPFWGRGIMSQAVAEFVRHAFDMFDLLRIYAEPFDNNRASVRILEKAGFFCEGRMRANVFKNGKVLDSLLYARVRDRAA